MEHPRQGEVFWANLDPNFGREIRKRRPVLVVSPDEMNRNLQTVIAPPITSTHRPWPTRCRISYRGRSRSVARDQNHPPPSASSPFMQLKAQSTRQCHLQEPRGPRAVRNPFAGSTTARAMFQSNGPV